MDPDAQLKSPTRIVGGVMRLGDFRGAAPAYMLKRHPPSTPISLTTSRFHPRSPCLKRRDVADTSAAERGFVGAKSRPFPFETRIRKSAFINITSRATLSKGTYTHKNKACNHGAAFTSSFLLCDTLRWSPKANEHSGEIQNMFLILQR